MSLEAGQHVVTGHLLQGFLGHFALVLLLASPLHPTAEASSLPRLTVPHRLIAQVPTFLPGWGGGVNWLRSPQRCVNQGSILSSSWRRGSRSQRGRWTPVGAERVSPLQISLCAHTWCSFPPRKTRFWPGKCWFLQLGALIFFFFFLSSFIAIQFTYHTVHPFKAYNSLALLYRGYTIYPWYGNYHHHNF